MLIFEGGMDFWVLFCVRGGRLHFFLVLLCEEEKRRERKKEEKEKEKEKEKKEEKEKRKDEGISFFFTFGCCWVFFCL